MSAPPPPAPAFAEFGAASNFSFLRAASSPEELVVTAELLGYAAIGIADRNTVSGVVRAWQQARAGEIAFHPGCRLVFSDASTQILAYPRDRSGWGNLCRMLTAANERGVKGAPDLLLDDLFERGDGISLALLPDFTGTQADGTLEFVRRLADRFPGCGLARRRPRLWW